MLFVVVVVCCAGGAGVDDGGDGGGAKLSTMWSLHPERGRLLAQYFATTQSATYQNSNGTLSPSSRLTRLDT